MGTTTPWVCAARSFRLCRAVSVEQCRSLPHDVGCAFSWRVCGTITWICSGVIEGVHLEADFFFVYQGEIPGDIPRTIYISSSVAICFVYLSLEYPFVACV